MFSIKGTIYEKFPLLVFTPFGMWDIGIGIMITMSVQNGFVSLQKSASWLGMHSAGDFAPPSK